MGCRGSQACVIWEGPSIRGPHCRHLQIKELDKMREKEVSISHQGPRLGVATLSAELRGAQRGVSRLISDYGGRVRAHLGNEEAKDASSSNSHRYILLERSYSISETMQTLRMEAEARQDPLSWGLSASQNSQMASRYCRQFLSFHCPSAYISTHFSLPRPPGSPGYQLE